MSAALNDVPAIHHQDFMRIDHGGQPVGNDQSRLVLRHALQLGLYRPHIAWIAMPLVASIALFNRREA